MTLVEILLLNVNEVIGRNLLGAVDVGDCIFSHMFGAYFGLSISKVLYNKNASKSTKAGATRTSDLFSMVGTAFLWVFWPSFNTGAAAEGDAQMRALINTYLALCASCMAAFAISALVNPQSKFCMEHIQNATLAGGVSVGATADMILTPLGAIIMGCLSGLVSTLGYRYVTPYLTKKWKVTDTCGVNNLHGMPSVMGGLLSVILAAMASPTMYDQFNSDMSKSSLHEIFPHAGHFNTTLNQWQDDKVFWGEGGWSGPKQAGRQMLAILVTLLFALGGGALTGLLMMCVARIQNSYNKQQSNLNHLALNTTQSIVYPEDLPKEQLFDDAFFFQEEEEDILQPLPTVYVSSPPLETNNNNNNNSNKGFVP